MICSQFPLQCCLVFGSLIVEERHLLLHSEVKSSLQRHLATLYYIESVIFWKPDVCSFPNLAIMWRHRQINMVDSKKNIPNLLWKSITAIRFKVIVLNLTWESLSRGRRGQKWCTISKTPKRHFLNVETCILSHCVAWWLSCQRLGPWSGNRGGSNPTSGYHISSLS